jgi:hypothetical protein
MKKPKRLLVSASLVMTACPAPVPPCGSEPSDLCQPDGAYVCPPSCGTSVQFDGGILLYPDGGPVCFC